MSVLTQIVVQLKKQKFPAQSCKAGFAFGNHLCASLNTCIGFTHSVILSIPAVTALLHYIHVRTSQPLLLSCLQCILQAVVFSKPWSTQKLFLTPKNWYVRPRFVDFQFLIRCFACAQCGWAGIIHSRQKFLIKELDKHDARRIKAHNMLLQKASFGCYAVDRHVW